MIPYTLACHAGATTLYLAWGPAVAAGVVSYRTAVLLGASCQFVGALVFGPHSFPTFLGILKPGTEYGLSPELVMYALLVQAFVLPVWQLLALWQQAPTASYLGAGMINCTRALAAYDLIALWLHGNMQHGKCTLTLLLDHVQHEPVSELCPHISITHPCCI